MENDTIGEKVDEYLRILGNIKEKAGDMHVALVILEQVMKDMRSAKIQEERSSQGNGFHAFIPATPGQIAYLKKLGADIPEGLGKLEASDLIDKLKAKESQADSFEYPEEMLNRWYSAWIEELVV